MSTRQLTAPARSLELWLTGLRRWHRPTPPSRITDPGALPDLSDHQARDIGLTPSEAEQARFRWPSSTGPRHPYW